MILRGTIFNRTYGTHQTLYISLFLLSILGPFYYAPPGIELLYRIVALSQLHGQNAQLLKLLYIALATTCYVLYTMRHALLSRSYSQQHYHLLSRRRAVVKNCHRLATTPQRYTAHMAALVYPPRSGATPAPSIKHSTRAHARDLSDALDAKLSHPEPIIAPHFTF